MDIAYSAVGLASLCPKPCVFPQAILVNNWIWSMFASAFHLPQASSAAQTIPNVSFAPVDATSVNLSFICHISRQSSCIQAGGDVLGMCIGSVAGPFPPDVRAQHRCTYTTFFPREDYQTGTTPFLGCHEIERVGYFLPFFRFVPYQRLKRSRIYWGLSISTGLRSVLAWCSLQNH